MTTFTNIPTGVESFSLIRNNNGLYVDKTKEILSIFYGIANNTFFISRPRRWGKSLTIDTIKELALGHKDLFKGTYAYDNYKDWNKSYPVLVFSFIGFSPEIDNNNLQDFVNNSLKIYIGKEKYSLKEYLIKYGNGENELKMTDVIDVSILIRKVKKDIGERPVVLFDEYDTPFTKNINNLEAYEKIKSFFLKFYGKVKSSGEDYKFFYLSGLTKVGQTSLFSTMNNASDITFNKKIHNIMGYTLTEIQDYFQPYFKKVCAELKISEEKMIKNIKLYYDGYNFGQEDNKLFNPLSINSFFDNIVFKNFWANTGSLSLISDFLKEQQEKVYLGFLERLDNKKVFYNDSFIKIENPENLTIDALLFQSGYLTVKGKNLVIPNKEAREEVYSHFFNFFSKKYSQVWDLKDIVMDLDKGIITGDKDLLEKVFNSSIEFSEFPSDWVSHNPEGGLKIGLSFFLNLCGFDWVSKEEGLLRGKSDIVVHNDKKAYIIEVKVDGKEGQAIQQINEQYISSFRGKEGFKFGVNYDKKIKKITVEVEKL